MPSKKTMEETVAKIEADIEKMRARFDEIKVEKQLIFSGFKQQKVGEGGGSNG